MTVTREKHAAPPDGAIFRSAMRQFIGNVSLITAGIGDNRSGIVATSAVAHSADPPTLLACINRDASILPLLEAYRHFGVNFLAGRHQPLADLFSGKTGVRGNGRFDGTEWVTKVTGVSLLKDAPAAFDCTIDDMIERGSHVIVIGEVRAIVAEAADDALAYWHGAYHTLSGKTL